MSLTTITRSPCFTRSLRFSSLHGTQLMSGQVNDTGAQASIGQETTIPDDCKSVQQQARKPHAIPMGALHALKQPVQQGTTIHPELWVPPKCSTNAATECQALLQSQAQSDSTPIQLSGSQYWVRKSAEARHGTAVNTHSNTHSKAGIPCLNDFERTGCEQEISREWHVQCRYLNVVSMFSSGLAAKSRRKGITPHRRFIRCRTSC